MIYFFYPSKITGGAEYLMVRMANLLSEHKYDVGVVDIEGGWIQENINNDGIYKIIFSKNKIKLNKNDVLITTSNFMYKLDFYFCKSEAKVLFWTVQPYNIVMRFPKLSVSSCFINIIGEFYLKCKKPSHRYNLDSIISRNGIVSMDGECDKILHFFYKLNYKNFLPIFIENEKFDKKMERSLYTKNLRLIWLGRIDLEFKIHILKKVLLDLNELRFEYHLSFDIVGDGPGLDDLKYFVENNIDFKVLFLKELRGEELNKRIKENDIGLAMGTSALDLAANGIATILLDFSYAKVDFYKYQWIYEAKDYTLGRDISFIDINEINEMKYLNEMIIELNDNRENLSKSCFEYVLENHSSQNAVSSFITLISELELSLVNVYEYKSSKPFWIEVDHFFKKLSK